MKPRGQTGIVLLAFAVGAVALVTGNLMLAPGTSPAMDALAHSRLGNWMKQTWLEHAAPPPVAGIHQAGIGDPRVDLQLPDVQGKLHKLSHWDGRRVLLNFWAPWCAPCRAEIPLLRQAQQQYAEQAVQIVGIAVDTPEHVRSWLDKHPSNYPVLVDAPDTHRAASSYGNTRALLPFSVLIGRNGTVLKRKYGALDEAELSRWLGP